MKKLRQLLRCINSWLYKHIAPKEMLDATEGLRKMNETLSYVIRSLGICPECEHKLPECTCMKEDR